MKALKLKHHAYFIFAFRLKIQNYTPFRICCFVKGDNKHRTNLINATHFKTLKQSNITQFNK